MKDAGFLTLIGKWWNQVSFEGSKIFGFVSKLKYVKRQLLEWNALHFKNIFVVKKKLEDQLEDLNDKVIKEGMSQVLFLEEKQLLAEYEDILSKEEILWKQKTRENWLQAGDRNIKFFHNVTRIRRGIKRISRLDIQGKGTIDDLVAIGNEIVCFFSKLLNNEEGSDLIEKRKLLLFIPKVISEDQNKNLNQSFSLEEVSISLNQLPSDKALGPDDFPMASSKNVGRFLNRT